jgi:hypothetical protein
MPTKSETKSVTSVDAPVTKAPDNERCTVYYNPISVNTRFFVGQQSSYSYFSNGRYVACTDEQKAAAESVLRYYGEDKVEAWQGDDRDTEYVAKSTGFRTRNSKAQKAHMEYFNL